ncbi:Transcription factor [Cardamine amara subsp. amara]|uniref:Transcription factor n=1 Tax=Cardamine amara subsp. amara TaxID=228776 RepID=A0ABD1BXI9_CARAN
MEEINNSKKSTHEEELYSLSEIVSSFCAEDLNELNPLQEIFGAPSSSEPKDVTNNIDEKLENEEDKKIEIDQTTKRQRSMEYRVLMEKKRRQLIRDKVETLQEMTPNCSKSDLATKLECIIEYIKSLQHQIDVMSMAYTATPVYTPPFYGAQAPCMSPWSYYPPGIPMMHQQNMPMIPQFHQMHDKAAPVPEQTKP